MIKKLKIGIFLTVLSLMAVVGVQNASASAVVFSDDTIVSIDSHDYIIESSSAGTTVVVNPTTLQVLVPVASTFSLSSAAGYTLTNVDDAGTPVVTAQTCSNGVSTVAYTGTGATVTFTPTTVVACSNGGSSGGGGGGSSSSSTPATPATPAVPAVVCAPGHLYSPTTGQKCNVTSTTTPATPAVPATPATPGSPSGVNAPALGGKVYNFGTALLKNGSRGAAAKELQRFLNYKLNLGLVVDGIIGPKTIAVIKTWQKANGLVVDGLIGPKTKAKMNASVQ